MRPSDIAFNASIADGINVFATAWVKVVPLDADLGDCRVVLIPDNHFCTDFNIVVLCAAGDLATFCGQLSKDGLFWRMLRGKGWDVAIGGGTLYLHTTNLFSGLLLISLGIALAMGYLTYINSLIPIELQLWFIDAEEKVLHLFM